MATKRTPDKTKGSGTVKSKDHRNTALAFIRGSADKGAGLERQPGEYGVNGRTHRGADRNGVWTPDGKIR